jgi:nitrite reductase (NADH) large subunit
MSFEGSEKPGLARERLVVIGNGMAGCRAVEEMLKPAIPRPFDITIFGAEPRVNYNRIMLSPVLAGEKTFDAVVIGGGLLGLEAANGLMLRGMQVTVVHIMPTG